MGEGIKNNNERQDKLREIVKDLNEGTDVKNVKKQFDNLIRNISPEEIAAIEQSLIDEGVPVEHVQKLCDIHVQVFDDALKKQKKSKVLPGHPVYSYRQENKELRKRLRALRIASRKPGSDFLSVLSDVKKIELHYVRKENQLFPFLEGVDFTGPSKVMWGKHDEIREQFRLLEELQLQNDPAGTKRETAELIKKLKNMIFMEERILLPASLRKLPESAWVKIRKGESSIGYAWIEPANLWDTNIVGAAEGTASDSSDSDGEIELDTGALTPFQINLMLKNLPFDMTFVDENGKVAYYSEGRERIFPRSPGIIGRDVANCHPPKSVHVVEKVVESLKNGEKAEAEFWLKINDQFVYIRYFPLFDVLGKYRGIIEVSQEVSGIKELTGERRLLDW
ncbi:MAG TPA: hypothetical protein DCO79_13805 [Spirochaeta sp.]|nr:hypothetical protein [Spirochaeta sp.]